MMTASHPAQIQANAKAERNKCTCGHHITGALSQIEDAGRTEIDGSSSANSGFPDPSLLASPVIIENVTFTPLDASFVQIPLASHASSSRSSSTEKSRHAAARTTLRQAQQLCSSNPPQALPHDSMSYCTSDGQRGLSRLHQAASSLTDPPPLCGRCTQRYYILIDL